MIHLPKMRLNTSVVLLFSATLLLTLMVVGSAILLFQYNRISTENAASVANASAVMARRVETFLDDVHSRVSVVAQLQESGYIGVDEKVLEQAREPSLSAIYVLDGTGILQSASVAGMSEGRVRELQGIDLSNYPIFREVSLTGRATWVDKHLSAVTGTVTLGLVVPIVDGGGVVIAELPLQTLLNISSVSRERGSLDYWIIDSNGEIVADTHPDGNKNLNFRGLSVVQDGFSGITSPRSMTRDRTGYHVAASLSQNLGWLFIARIPAGLANPRMREIIGVVLIVLVSSVLVGAAVAPVWARQLARPLRSVAHSAYLIARGKMPEAWPSSGIVELNRLSTDLGVMADAIVRREEELRSLNEELEARVAERTFELTQTNEDLSTALQTVEKAKEELIQAEKMAALGRLVAGVAHEMNTPLGNGRMAISTLSERLENFKVRAEMGMTRRDLREFIDAAKSTTEIAELNMRRASDLVSNFKEVAADRTSSRRREFPLREIVEEILLTLTPALRNATVTVRNDVAEDIVLDSYPGELGQILTNLVENALRHAFKEQDGGVISISGRMAAPDTVEIKVADDGVGMDAAVAEQAFDPFFTTEMGSGGTGLGLFICHNTVANVLGGGIALRTEEGVGTEYLIEVPRVAPEDRQEPLPSAV